MSKLIALAKYQSANGQTWWESLSDHSRCVWAAIAAERMYNDAAEVRYAVEKPWKFAHEAWLIYCEDTDDDAD